MIGIIAGEGSLPKVLINNFLLKKKKVLVINLSKKKIKKKNFFNFKITELSKIIKTLKTHNCKEVILAGKVTRPRIQDLKIDFNTLKIIPKIIKSFRKGDSYALDFVIDYFRKINIHIVSCTKYLPELAAENFKKKFQISAKDKKDIEKGNAVLNHINNKHDVGQSIIVNNGYIVGIEAAEGTDQMILKSKKILKKINKNKSGGVLVKIPKKIQDLRVDLPTIGYNTIRNCLKVGLRGIALKKNQNIFLDQEKSLNLIKNNNFFITFVN
jgi:DUF1009 family protein